MSRRVRTLGLLAFAAALAPVRAAPAQELFDLTMQDGRPRLSASLTGLSTREALSAVARRMGWRMALRDQGTAALLDEARVEIAVARRDPMWVAELLALAAGCDAELLSSAAGLEGPPTLMVGLLPEEATGRSRETLGARALQWYRRVLESPLPSPPDIRRQARFALARTHRALGQLQEAARAFETFAGDDRDDALALRALLEAARCRLALGQNAEARIHAEDARLRAGTRPEALEALALVGESFLAKGRLDDAVRVLELEPAAWRHPVPGLRAVGLLLADVHRIRGRPDQVLRVLARLPSAPPQAAGGDEHTLMEHFLAGWAHGAAGRPLRALELLAAHLRGAPAGHRRRGEALLAYASASFALGRLPDALAAAREARATPTPLPPAAAAEAALLEHRAALELGLGGVLDRLEAEVAGLEPEARPALVLLLAEAALESGLPERARRALEPLLGAGGSWGDRARHLTLVALSRQELHAEVVGQGPALAARIQDTALQTRAALLVGDAWKALGRPWEAAEAYAGRLR